MITRNPPILATPMPFHCPTVGKACTFRKLICLIPSTRRCSTMNQGFEMRCLFLFFPAAVIPLACLQLFSGQPSSTTTVGYSRATTTANSTNADYASHADSQCFSAANLSENAASKNNRSKAATKSQSSKLEKQGKFTHLHRSSYRN